MIDSSKIKYSSHLFPILLIILSLLVIGLSVMRELYLMGLGLGILYFIFTTLAFLVLIIELVRIIFFIFSGGSLFDLKIREGRDRPYSRLKLDFVALIIWIISTYLFFANPGWFPTLKHSTQEELVKYCQKNRDEFNVVVSLVQTAGNDNEIRAHLKKLGLTGEFEIESNNHLKQLDLSKLHKIESGNIYFYLYRNDIWANAGYHKGFVYSENTLTPLVKNIDKDKIDWCKRTYQNIDGNWYLFYYYY